MKKALEITLGAIADLIDVIEMLKTDITISDSHKTKDLRDIVSLLEKAADLAIDAVAVFAKYENPR
jgi:hypothetical protein